jgi:hypothetical protein
MPANALRQLVEAVFDTAEADAEVAFQNAVDRLRAQVDRMAAEGLAPEAVSKALSAKGGQALKDIVTRTLSGAAQGAVGRVIEDGLAFGREVRLAGVQNPDSVTWTWVTMGDDRVCEDLFENSCSPRHGSARPLSQWEKFGLPQGPHLVCSLFSKGGGSNCRCFLAESDLFEVPVKPFDASEALKAGRARAQKKIAA